MTLQFTREREKNGMLRYCNYVLNMFWQSCCTVIGNNVKNNSSDCPVTQRQDTLVHI